MNHEMHHRYPQQKIQTINIRHIGQSDSRIYMPVRFPPLAALRAFEAAARLESFSRAADEIHVTHGAVSHQVRALEDFIGVPLFMREGRGVVLTGDGRTLAAEIRAGLAQIGAAAEAIRRRARSNRLTISVLPSFGSRWLMPRIGRFMSALAATARVAIRLRPTEG